MFRIILNENQNLSFCNLTKIFFLTEFYEVSLHNRVDRCTIEEFEEREDELRFPLYTSFLTMDQRFDEETLDESTDWDRFVMHLLIEHDFSD